MIYKVDEAKEVDVGIEYKGKLDMSPMHLWQEDLPKVTEVVLKEIEDMFLKDFPPGLPQICKRHEFKIDLEDETPPTHQPIYKLNPLELEEAKKQIEYVLKHGFI